MNENPVLLAAIGKSKVYQSAEEDHEAPPRRVDDFENDQMEFFDNMRSAAHDNTINVT
jgi:hypothetical protein